MVLTVLVPRKVSAQLAGFTLALSYTPPPSRIAMRDVLSTSRSAKLCSLVSLIPINHGVAFAGL